MSTSIEEKMSKIDRTIWNKLHASIKPHLNRIEREEDKLKNIIKKTIETIEDLKTEISDYQKMISEIEAKYEEPESVEETLTDSTSEESFGIDTEISMKAESVIDGSNDFLRDEYSE